MKSRLPLVAVVIFALLPGGCASPHQTVPPTSRLAKKRLEIETLQEEVNIAIGNLDALQRELAGIKGNQFVTDVKVYHSAYPLEAQERDLDRLIQVLRRTRNSLSAEERRLLSEYEVTYSVME